MYTMNEFIAGVVGFTCSHLNNLILFHTPRHREARKDSNFFFLHTYVSFQRPCTMIPMSFCSLLEFLRPSWNTRLHDLKDGCKELIMVISSERTRLVKATYNLKVAFDQRSAPHGPFSKALQEGIKLTL